MDKIWLKNYPANIPEIINNSKETLNDLFKDACEKYADNKAFTCNDESITYQQTYAYVNNLAASLLRLGVARGDRVAIILPNLLQYPLAIFAILKIGAIVVNVNPLYTTNEIDYLLSDSGAKVVIILDMMAHKLNELYLKHNLEHVVVTKVGDIYPFIKRTIFNFVIKYIKRVDVSYSYKAHSFRDLICSNSLEIPAVDITPEDIAFIQYTGATTGKPKGVMLLHRSIVSNLAEVRCWLDAQIKPLSNEVVIDALPLYHIFSLTANLFTFFFYGSENIMVPNPRDVKELLNLLKKNNFTIFSALDTLYNHLLNYPEFVATKFPSFKYSVAGGMPLRESVAKEWARVTGVVPINCYGLTETSPAVTMNKIGDTFDGSVGYPIPSTEVEIRDKDSGEILGIGQSGVIWIRGPQLMSGYWNNPEQTTLVIDKNGWFNSKDLGYFNEQGKLFLNGRQSEMIIVSGFNVYPAEVECVLDKIPQVRESAVIGIPDNNTGESVVAFIVFKSGQSIKESEIIYKCRKDIAGYKVPKHIYIADELPKTLIGKIDKVELRKKFVDTFGN